MITSKSNDLIKQCLQIKQKKYSKELGLCLVESLKLVRELEEKGLIEKVLVVDSKVSNFKNSKTKIEVISDSIANYLADTVTTDGVFGVCRIIESSNVQFERCLVLDRIQDPSNLGAIIRSACAFGFTTIFSINSVYPYSYKVIRSSMGYVFDMNIIDVSYETLVDYKSRYNLTFLSADMDGQDVGKVKLRKDSKIAIIIGNEGSGVSDEVLALSDKVVSIPMDNDVESLNASVSAGIMMYLLK